MKKHVWFNLEEHPEIFYGQYIVPNFISNSIAIRCSESHWLILSPGKEMLNQLPEGLDPDNHHLSIVFPNSFHHMGVKAWIEKFPNHSLYASQKAAKRLATLGFDNIQALESKQPEIPEGYKFAVPPGHRGGDIWLCKITENAANVWITCDSFLNYERVSNQPIARFLQKLLGAAPGLKISQVIKWLIMDKYSAFKPWVLKQLAEDKPEILIPSHGEIDRDKDLTSRLEQLVKSRL